MPRRIIAFLALVIGIIAIVLGIAIGTISHHVSYRHVEEARIIHYLTIPDETHQSVSIQLANDQTLYALPLSNFTPSIDGKQLFKAGYIYASFYYDIGLKIHIDVLADTGTHLVGDAYNIVSITFSDGTGNQKVFNSQGYIRHPQGYDDNTWPPGLITIGVGVLLVIVGVILFMRKERTRLSNNITGTPGNPLYIP